ncbi:MAG TPA: helix-turn-helix domain-containing protein [Chloroflexota bacterium]|jgi:transcriptional regulator GlxA family with amidase domain|nr:helix-turn-helix domain-containing protein [Chloroflexota bacterium]
MAPITTVAALAFEQVAPFELAVACEVFGVDRSDMDLPNYDFFVCAMDQPPLQVKGNLFTINTPYRVEDLERAGTIVVPATSPVVHQRPAEHVLEALRSAHDRGARILSVCSGAFVLAAAGLLDGRRATTHWMYAAELARQYPKVKVDPKVLYVGEDNIYTSAGTAAGIDLCLHIVRLDYGAEVANMFARRMVVPPHRDGGQAQYVDLPVPATPEDHDLSATLSWMRHSLEQELTVPELARRAHMSPRTFARRFVAATGTTPHKWLLSQRILRAQQLLESTDLPVELVAERSGLGSAATLRQHFQRQLDTSPQAYRRTFKRSA